MSEAAGRKDKTINEYSDVIYDAEWFNNPKTIQQLATGLNTPVGKEQYIGKSFELTGFVRADRTASSDYFLLTRFVMACCAADARPNSIAVLSDDWQSEFAVDSWVTVSGELVKRNVAGQELIMIEPKTIRKIDLPEEPYDFISN